MQLRTTSPLARTKGAILFSKSAINGLQPIFAKLVENLAVHLICDFMAIAIYKTLEAPFLVNISTFLQVQLRLALNHTQITVLTTNLFLTKIAGMQECPRVFGMANSLDQVQSAGWEHIRSLEALRL